MKKFLNRFKRVDWLGILSFALVIVLLVSCTAGLLTFVEKDTKTIYPTFAVGSVNQNGNYTETDTSIYTPDLVECQGLSIEPDFDSTGTYQVFYYNANKEFIGATPIMNAADGVYNKGTDFSYAMYCRIVITPSVPVDANGAAEEDFKIRFWEVHNYVSKYSIAVNKTQKKNIMSENVFAVDPDSEGKLADTETYAYGVSADYSMSAWIDTQGATRIKVVQPVAETTSRTFNRIYFGEAYSIESHSQLNFNTDYTLVDDHYEIIVDLPEGCDSIIFGYLTAYPLEVYLLS